MFIKRYDKNPILKPKGIHSWEAYATFNGCPITKGDKVYLLYRALSLPHFHPVSGIRLVVSNIGIGVSKNGIDFHDRKWLVIPELTWEKFGCEDPRVTKFEGKYFIFYTALSTYPFTSEGIKVGLAITKDLRTIEGKHLITHFNAKAMALFPERVDGKIWAILTVHTDKPPSRICLANFDKEEEIWQREYWEEWYKNYEKYSLPLQRDSQDHLEIGAPPLKTKYGWLLLYSYIKNYFTPDPIFGVEAFLLDLKNPFKLIAKTDRPLLVPEEYYEKIGLVPNVIFPSGTLLVKNTIYLYYGAADTTCCLAFIRLPALLRKLLKKGKPISFERAEENPIITPQPEHAWEAKATFNPGVVYLGGKIHLIYRAVSEDNVSTLGYATTKDGIHIDYRSPEPVYVPRERFEKKVKPNVSSGCEDPRLTLINSRIYMCYTAFDGEMPRVALTWIEKDDFLKQNWDWARPVLISPPGIDDKDACIFPEKVKVNGEKKYFILHRCGDDIDSALTDTLNFDGKTWIEEYRWIAPRRGWWDGKKVGIATPPLKVSKGWILLYHGVSDDNVYRVGAILLNRKNPLQAIARTEDPIFEPQLPYEKAGLVNNVVFPCGAVIIKDKIFMYYGCADRVIGVATIEVKKLLKILMRGKI